MASEKWPRPPRDPRDPDDPRLPPQPGPPDFPGVDQHGQIRRGGEPPYGNGPPGALRNGDWQAVDARYADGAVTDPRYRSRPTRGPRYGSGPGGDPHYGNEPARDAGYGYGPTRQDRYGDWPAPMDARRGPGQAGAGRYDSQAGDPRFGRRLPQDPRLAGDPRFAAGAQPGFDPRFATDPRIAPDPRLAPDPRRLAPDPRFAADPRLAADPRITGNAWFGPGHPGQASDPWGLVQRTGPEAPRPYGRPPLAIETRRLAIEAPRPADQPAEQRKAPGITDPLRLIDPRRSAVLREADLRAATAAPPQAGRQRTLGENTRSVRLPVPAPPGQQPLAMPIYRTAAFGFGSSAEYAAVLNGAAPGFSYSRIDNPTVEAFCAAVAALEGVNLSYQTAAQAFASGMAAVSTVLWAFARAGAHVVAPAAIYGGTYSFLRNVASSFGVQTDFVDMTDLALVKAALRSGTAIVYAETLANPTVAVTDLAGIARLAHEAGALLVVDSTLAPPVICRPLEHGADLVLHSATKYFGGHSDVTGGVVTGHPELIKRIRDIRIDTGGSLGPDDAYLLRRGLETLPLRVRRQCATAQLLAAGLVRHPAVRAVYYPGLGQHPGHGLARRQFDAGPEGTRFGAILTIAPHGGQEAGMAFADRLRLAQVATSLGGTHTKVSHVGSTTHRQMDSAALAAAGIDPGSVRFSVGLEDGDDLLADAMAALDSLGGR